MMSYRREIFTSVWCARKFFVKFGRIFCIFKSCCTFLMGTSFSPEQRGRKTVISEEEIVMRKFDTCIKKALVQELKYRKRSMKNQRARIVNFSELSNLEAQSLYSEDTYPAEKFQKTVETKLFDAVICNELLYESLQVLTPSNREILLLKYWGRMTDSEIGQILSMSQQMVNYHRGKSLRRLKTIIEEMMQNDQRFKL